MEKAEQAPLTFSNKTLLYMIIPVILNDLFSRVVNIADSVMVSSVGEAAVSAISLTGTLYMVFSNIVGAFAIGAGVVFAQYLGARDPEAGRSALRHSFWLNLAIGTALALIVIPMAGPLVTLVFPGTAPDIWENSVLCLQMYMGLLPFFAVEQICVYSLISMGRNRYVLLLNLGKNLANIAGNALFIYGLDWGLFGALLSTLLSHVIFCVAAVWLLHKKSFPLHFTGLLSHRLNKQQTRLIFQVGAVTIVERALFNVGGLLSSSMTASLPATELAACSVSKNVVGLGWASGFAFATTLGSVVGQCIGADQPQQAKYYTKRMLLTGYGIAAVVFAAAFCLRQPLVSIYDLADSTKVLAADYVGLGCLLTVFGGHAVVVILASAFRAAGDLRYTTVTAIGSMFLCQVGLGYVFIFLMDLGVMGIWLAMGADWLGRAVLYSIHALRGKWLTKKLI